ncbi:hypothetical protein Lfu02_39980 [Longispora fulva]|uniref:DUF4240 domain-containing protein n=1 Tax=Longispora fulva TaxID=619741 RepID=A0A8J7KJ22_9ACTN|nr:DUF4240 domain-containing protein [Longispora fulva]MBG6136459.1 hypothetical protein [Longispora fulva]GIG59626.1 hypothetical protein Lfu02_39980 [Longispora fulva]
MDEDTFWALVAESRHDGGSNTELVSRVLFRRLRALDATDVVEFVRFWEQARSLLYSWPVTDAACLLLGPVEEEDLCHIQDWIISYGRTVVERIARDPDALTDLASDAGNARAQWFGEFITEAHIVVSGIWPPGYDPDGPDDLIGERLDLDDWTAVRRRFPSLAAFRRDHPELGNPELR